MKNQFIIAESERERILSLHQQSTKKQYLNVLSEQEQFYKGSDGKVGKLVGPQVLPAGATKISQQEYDTAMKTQQKPDEVSAAFEKWYNESMGLSTFKSLITNNNANGIMEILNYNFKDKPDYITKFKELLVAKHPTLKFNEQSGTTSGTTDSTWLKFPGDKNYEYLKKENKWFTRKVGTTKEFDLSSNPKYKTTVDKLNKQLLGTAKTPQGTNVMDELEKNPAAKSVIDALKKANFDFNQMKPEQLLPTLQKYFGDFLQQNPTTLPQIKTDIENLLKIKLPEITATTGEPNVGTNLGTQGPEVQGRTVVGEF